MSVIGVSRETGPGVFSPRLSRHIPRSDAPTPRGALAKCELMDAIVALAADGIYRPSVAEVARRARRSPSNVNAHFDYLHMLQRAAVRFRTKDLADALKLSATLSDVERERLVWLIVAGVEKPK